MYWSQILAAAAGVFGMQAGKNLDELPLPWKNPRDECHSSFKKPSPRHSLLGKILSVALSLLRKTDTRLHSRKAQKPNIVTL